MMRRHSALSLSSAGMGNRFIVFMGEEEFI
jgi:hypothetical protein